MTTQIIIEIAAVSSILAGAYFLYKKNKKIKTLTAELDECKSNLRSAYVKFGKTFEHFAPFTKNFPGAKENFVFLGMPLDGICFDEDSIKFIEIKTGSSKLSPKQEKIKKLIEDKKVEFKEVRY